MGTQIFHLNCGTMCPLCAQLINGAGGFQAAGKLVCHCLFIVHEDRLILIDTGFGLQDLQHPKERLGKKFIHSLKPQLDPEETAYKQIEKLGFRPDQVTDIFPTHLDLDHIGGLTDFPQATVHIYQSELDQLLNPGIVEKIRFHSQQFHPMPKWKIYDQPRDCWFGLSAFLIDCIPNLNMVMLPLIGHTKGHVAIGVQQHDTTWLLHCGDAYFHHSQLSAEGKMPTTLKIFEVSVQMIRHERIKSLKKLKKLKADHGDEIEFFCAHDLVEFARYTSTLTVDA
jgi:glyoxylase-like metal-dependent hydrolase (beta-lactamase superfamily II)